MTSVPMRLLFVCTGNTCRSPMAAVIARAGAARRQVEVEVHSAGLMAGPGMPAAEHARAVAAAHGLDLSSHRARTVTPDLLALADLVLGMTARHVDAVRVASPGADVRLVTDFLPEDHPLAGVPMGDPFGGDLAEYEQTWDELETAIEALLEQLEARRSWGGEK